MRVLVDSNHPILMEGKTILEMVELEMTLP